ncbi:MAG: hypothetical protein C5B51_28140 [Terriglobia bacterium]|nr:MAG: hypothetical protein C5B51_28140 [Terriglobia bacterium]
MCDWQSQNVARAHPSRHGSIGRFVPCAKEFHRFVLMLHAEHGFHNALALFYEVALCPANKDLHNT